MRAWISRLGAIVGSERSERDLAAEMESHLRMQIEDNMRAGMTREQARREVIMKLGGIEQTKENYRERRGLPLLETLLRDLRYAARMLGKTPAFTLIAIIILALGIASNIAVFSLVDALLLRNLAVPEPQKLVRISF